MAKKKDLSPLDLDLIQCEKDGFGCHYGKWKATQETKKVEKEEPEGFVIRVCQNCGDRCRRQAEYKVYKERNQNG